MSNVEYRVRYKREGWQRPQQRIFQARYWADRLVRKLRGWSRPDLSPIEYITVEQRPVGEWEASDES